LNDFSNMMTDSTLSRAAALAALLLAGCANFSSISPGDSVGSVADRVGAPGNVWKNPDGSEVWEYPSGYYGVQAFMIAVGPDQTVREVRQVLSEETFSKVQPGMSREEVHRLLGRPREIWYFPPRDEESWTWRYYDINYRLFSVLFDRTQGTVRTVLRLDEPRHEPGQGRE
jgi:hypothetical protein